jgi:hypothetical protein
MHIFLSLHAACPSRSPRAFPRHLQVDKRINTRPPLPIIASGHLERTCIATKRLELRVVMSGALLWGRLCNSCLGDIVCSLRCQ